jgi:hypothetical protein
MVTRRSLKFSGESHEIFSVDAFWPGGEGWRRGPMTPTGLFVVRAKDEADVADDDAQIRLKEKKNARARAK